MDVDLFRDSPTGQLVPIAGSGPEGLWRHYAFLPNPLGESGPELAGATYRKVSDARAALAALDSTAQLLPNPRLFRYSVLRLEAQSTAALEGTYEPLDRILASDPEEGQDPSLREVLNYLTVAEAAFEWNEQRRRWTTSALGELHSMLMAGTAGERDFSGIRPIQVVIGRREGVRSGEIPIKAARFVPTPPGDVFQSRVAELLDWIQTDHRETIDPVVAAAVGHYTFEALHPFHDGNGRIGRLFIVLQLHRHGVLSEPTITVSPWFEARRQAYYDALLGVSTHGDWDTWVAMFAEGLAMSATEARIRMVALADVQAELKEELQRAGVRTGNARRLVDFAVSRPTFTVQQAADALDMKYPGTKKLIDTLSSRGILAQFGQRSYNRLYHSPKVVSILRTGHAPAR